MKTNILLSFCLSLVASAAPISPTPVGVPENIPFGKHVVTNALASVSQGNIQVYGNGLSETSHVGFGFEPVDSTPQLADIVRLYKPTVRVKNPLEIVWVRSALLDDKGNERLVAQTSYRHVVKRDSKGHKTYVVPRYAGSLYYEVTEQSFTLEGAESAMAVSVDGNIFNLEVVDGVVKIPPFIVSNTEYWNLLQVTLNDGSVFQYDSGGNRLRNLINVLQPEYVDVQSIYRTQLDKYQLDLTFAPQYGWNPIVEFSNDRKQYITLNLVASESSARPTHIRVYTLDQERNGTKPAWIEYSPENVDYYRESLEVPLDPGVYFIEMEWPSYIQYQSGGGKG